jgi:hypothetical protein
MGDVTRVRDRILKAVGGNEAIAEPVHAAIRKLFERDAFLLRNNVNERTISHRLAMYMQEGFPDWDVDCEYNRNHDNPKRIPLPRTTVQSDDVNARTVFPDIIVHNRNTDENLLVVEIKKTTNPEKSAEDLEKLYTHALFIRFVTGPEGPEIEEIRAPGESGRRR